MKLPFIQNAVIPPAKIISYLLSDVHSTGKHKAAFFKRFGFSVDSWHVLETALHHHADSYEVVSTLTTEQGIHYVIEGRIESPDQRNPYVRTVWALDTDSRAPRFITAYPIDENKP